MIDYIVAAIICLTPTGTTVADYLAFKATDEETLEQVLYAAQVIPFISGGQCTVAGQVVQHVEPFTSGWQGETQ